MTRRILITLLAVSMSAHLIGCSSNSSKDDTSVAESNDETFAEEGEGDFADESATQTADATTTESTESTGESVAATDAPAAGTDDLALDDPSASSSANAENTETTTTTETTETANATKPAEELSLDEPSALPEEVATNSSPVENITDNPATPSDAGVFSEPAAPAQDVASAPPVSEPAVTESTTTSTETSSSVVDSAPAKPVVYAPLLKVKDSAFTAAGGTTLNRVYLARPKDTTKSVSTKLYGATTHTKDLVKWNPVLKRGVRAGDKIYYASATNPSDSRMMNYYEEAGVPAQTYVSKDGDNLRTVSKTLLGFNDAWKEVWSTNANVESKGKIPSGLEIKYWPETGVSSPVQTMASTTPPASTDMNGGMPSTLPDQAPVTQPSATVASSQPAADPFASNGSVPPAATGQVVDNGTGADPFAPPPPTDMAASGAAAGTAGAAATDPMAQPPVAAQVAATPIPAPAVAKAKKATIAAADDESMSDDTTMALGVGGVLLVAAAVLFVLIRKNRAKRMDLGQTQV